jgi:hypothetical protein
MIMGINVGPMLLAIENYRSQMLWQLTTQNPEIAAGLDGIFGVGAPRHVAVSMAQTGDHHKVQLSWNSEPGASGYSIYTSSDLENWSLRQAGIRGTSWTDNGLGKALQRFYQVKGVR